MESARGSGVGRLSPADTVRNVAVRDDRQVEQLRKRRRAREQVGLEHLRRFEQQRKDGLDATARVHAQQQQRPT